MRIPGGDLVPARHRRYGGSYGRRRRRRNRWLIALGLLLAAAGIGAWYVQKDEGATPASVSTLPTCAPTPTATPTRAAVVPHVALPPATAVVLSVLNGTNRDLLAKHVADALASQGFHVTGQANARTSVVGASQIVYGPGASLQARTVSLWVPGSTVVPAPKARRGSVQVVLGSSFTRLATPAEAAAARRGPLPTTSAAPSATPTVLRCRA